VIAFVQAHAEKMKLALLAYAIAGLGWSSAEHVQKPLGSTDSRPAPIDLNTPKHGRKLKGRFLQITGAFGNLVVTLLYCIGV